MDVQPTLSRFGDFNTIYYTQHITIQNHADGRTIYVERTSNLCHLLMMILMTGSKIIYQQVNVHLKSHTIHVHVN